MASVQFQHAFNAQKALQRVRDLSIIGRPQSNINVEPCQKPKRYHLTSAAREEPSAPPQAPKMEPHIPRSTRPTGGCAPSLSEKSSGEETDSSSDGETEALLNDVAADKIASTTAKGAAVSIAVQLPAVKYGRPRRLLSSTPAKPLVAVSMRRDIQFIDQRTRFAIILFIHAGNR